jgi:hypothetical protein
MSELHRKWWATYDALLALWKDQDEANALVS